MTIEEVSSRELFSALLETADQALQAPESWQRELNLAGHQVRLSISKAAPQKDIWRAIRSRITQAPLASTITAPRILVFTGKTARLSALFSGLWMKRGEVKGFKDERYFFGAQGDGEVLTAFDAQENVMLCWYRSSDTPPDYIRAAPLLHAFHYSLQQFGSQLVHAAAIGSNGTGALLVGPGGSGKSTTAISCLLAGMDYVADDYCVLSADNRVHNLYSSGKMFWRDLWRVPEIQPSGPQPKSDEKALFFLDEYFSQQLKAELNLGAILLPQVSGNARTTLYPLSSARALTALAPSTIFQLPHTGQHTFKRLADLTKSLPCYLLELGTESTEVADCLKSFLSNREVCNATR